MTVTEDDPAARSDDGTVAELGEFGLIGRLRARLPQGEDVLLGPGDDSAVVAVPDGRMLASTDVLVEGRHFRRDWSSPYEIGRKAAAQNLADIAAMGGHPQALLVGLGCPPDLPAEFALAVADGLRDECDLVGAGVAGGDVVAADQVVIAVTALGTLRGAPPVTRAGARPGDVVAVCGRLGWSAAGLAVLLRGVRSPRAVVAAHLRPEPPYDAGPEAARLGATAMIDVSDGLLADLGHIARASGVRIDLTSSAFEVPEPLRAVGAATTTDPLTYVLTGGEDHALAATFPSDLTLPERWRTVGTVRAVDGAGENGAGENGAGENGGGENSAGVTVDGEVFTGDAGHAHF